jgi:hypothetical protein
MHSKTFAWFGWTILVLGLGCTTAPERANVNAISGVSGSGGQGGAAGAGGQSTVPYIEPSWIKVLPDVELSDMVLDATNHLVVTGYGDEPTATIDGIPVPLGQTFVAKLGPEGELVWLRSFGSGQHPQAVAVGPENRVFVLGKTPKLSWGAPPPNPQWERFFLTAFASDGSFLWEQSFGGDSSKDIRFETNGVDLAVDTNGNAMIVTAFAGQLDTPMGTFQTIPNDSDVFFIRIDAYGSIVEVKQFEAPGTQYVGGVAIDTAGQIIATANIGGSESVVKLDETLSPVWARSFPGDGSVGAMAVTIAKNDDIVIAGAFRGTVDFGNGPVQAQNQATPFLHRLDAAGNDNGGEIFSETSVIWPLIERLPITVAANPSGNHAFALQFSSSVDLGSGPLPSDNMFYDSALARYTADGTYVACADASGPGEQRTSGLVLSPEGRLYWAVSYLWTLKYGDQVLFEPPPSDSPFVSASHGSAIIALPP